MRTMKKSLVLGIALVPILLGLVSATSASAQSLSWARNAGGPNFDQGLAIAVDAAGNAYVAGFFTGSATFGRGESGETTLTADLRDMFVAKYDAAGGFLWVRRVRGADAAIGEANAIAVDTSGNAYVAGYFRFGLLFEDGTILEIGAGVTDFFVAKYDTDGNFRWARQGGANFIPGVTSNGNAAFGIAADAAGNSHVTGVFGTVLATGGAFVAKYDTNGELLWANDAGTQGVGPGSFGTSISVDHGGRSFVTGTLQGGNGENVELVVNGSFEQPVVPMAGLGVFESLPGWTQFSGFTGIEVQRFVAGSPYHGEQFVELDSFAPTGILQEVRTQPGQTYTLRFAYSPRPGTGPGDNVLRVTWGGQEVAVLTADGSAISDTTWTVHTLTVTGGPGVTTTLAFEDLGVSNTYGTYVDAVSVTGAAGIPSGYFLARFEADGAFSWVNRVAAPPGSMIGQGVSVDTGGNAVVTGIFADIVVFGAGEAAETTLTGGLSDVFVAKYGGDGTLRWAKQSTGARIKQGHAVAVDSTGASLVTGYFDISIRLGAGEANDTTLAGSGQTFVAKFDANGGLVWARQTNGPAAAIGRGIGVDANGNAYVAGPFGHVGGDFADPISVVFGQGETNETTLTTGIGSGTEIFVAKFSNGSEPANRPPVADDQSVTTPEDTALAIILTASDPDPGDMLTFSIVSGPAHGTLSTDLPTPVYTPTADYTGPDSFTFRVHDGTVFSAAATVSISVEAVNDPPVAQAQSVSTPENVAVSLTLLANDVDDGILSYSIVDPPAHGTVSNPTGATVTYTPATNYVGPDSFTFRASDGVAFSAPALVTIAVDLATVPCGALLSGAIGAAREIDRFTYRGQAGQIVTLALASTGGFSTNPGSSASATLTLVAPSGEILGTLRSNSLNNFTLPATGIYELRVNATSPTRTGSYNLSVHCLLPVPMPAPSVPCGGLQAGTLTAPGDVDLHSFSGTAGRIITLVLASAGGFSSNPGSSASATVTLFAPSGTVVGMLRSNSLNRFTLPASGTYVLRVHATNLATSGAYNVGVQCLLPPSLAPLLECGALQPGTLTDAGDMDQYSFNGALGQIVTLALASTAGFSSNPGSSASGTLTLIAPDGVVLAGLRSNSLNSFTLPATGTYVLQIAATNLATIGSYNVSLHCLQPTPTPAPGLQCGLLQSGTLTAPGDLDQYSFNGAAGQIVTLALASTGGFSSNPGSSASATLTVIGPDGVVLAGLRSNSLNSFTLPATGTYVLQIAATNLATIGSYNVSLLCLLPTPTPAPVLQCGLRQPGTLTAPGDLDLYSFSGAAGQIVTLALASTGGFSSNPGSSASATLTLFAPSGMVVGALRSNSLNNFTLPVTGTYALLVQATNLATRGTYNLSLQCLLPVPMPAAPLQCGTNAGALAAPADVDLYSFSGGLQTLRFSSTGGFSTNPGGSASATLVLFGSDGAVVAAIRSNSQANFTLTAPGPYMIRVTATNLSTAGSYVIWVPC